MTSYPLGSDVRGAAEASGLLTKDDVILTNFTNDATYILEGIKSKELTAVQVVTAFAKRAALAHQHVNCLTDFFMDEAIERAKQLDEYYEKTGLLVGPLHGLPISAKDNQSIKGHYVSNGFLHQFRKYKEDQHGHMLQILWDAGAVFYVKTNLPQSVMHLETHSFYGQTLNPYNTALTSGGSSGGCSALLAYGGSPLGLGNDIGGSLRSPAGATGLWTLKCTTSRLPSAGGVKMMPGADSVGSTQGPMCRSLRDLKLWFQVVMASKPWMREYTIVSVPWDTSALIPAAPKVKIGVMWSDGVVTPQPPIHRALKTLVAVLQERSDVEIKDYTPYKHAEMDALVHELYFVDGGKMVRDHAATSGEPLLPMTEWVLTRPQVKMHDIFQLWDMNMRRDTLRAEHLAHFNAQDVDFVLCPVGPGPAPAHHTAKYWGYTSSWNFLDYPAAVFPTGLKADPQVDLDAEYAKAPALNELDAYNRECYAKPEVFKNAPLCLQLVSRRNADDQVLDVLEKISECLPLAS
ncbi:amidase signature domain-containing protein [Schizophyllum amplum]|uniref:amidase n=1 Tax=Schizophyllum amplum TaxID=97359 RepID=A0A550CPY2_9AGAR|nr:amidase signature domain-containing protein [Auriculariopsis ampla]